MGFKITTMQITFRMDEEIHNEVEKRAEARGIKSTDFMREAIYAFAGAGTCPVCGALTVKDSRFCSSCGRALNKETAAKMAEDEAVRFEHLHAVLSRPQVVFAGKTKTELAEYKAELDRLLTE